MTFFGKLLAVLNLVVGLGLLAWSVSIYAHPPGWLDPVPEGVSPGQQPSPIAQLKADIDALGRAAVAASANWGAQRKALEEAEALRAKRLKGYEQRLVWTRTGNPAHKDADGNPTDAGFFEPVYDATGLLDLATVGPPIKGPDNRPLKGVDKLGTDIAKDTALILDYTDDIDKQLKVFEKVSADVVAVEARLRRMAEIRDTVQAERFYLDTFEVNVYETRETVLRRKRQLVQRLAELGK